MAHQIRREDAEYFIEHNINYPLDRGNGFLMRRCIPSQAAPEGAECVGGYDHSAVTGKWTASVQTWPDEESGADAQNIGTYDSPDAAIEALWNARTLAVHRYPRY
ncbi:hypothetical protein [Cupriavidus sp. Marseille-Q8015]